MPAVGEDTPRQPAADASLAGLLDQARAGDAAAREKLFGSCRNYLSIMAQAQLGRWLHARLDASDLVQQTLLDAHRAMNDFAGRGEEEWLAWLRQILAHNAADLARRHGAAKRATEREISLEPVAGADESRQRFEPAAPDETPSQLVSRHEATLQVADAVAALPADYQQVIVLRNVECLPFDEVAQRMGRSRPAVQMLWMRAIRALRELPTFQSALTYSAVH